MIQLFPACPQFGFDTTALGDLLLQPEIGLPKIACSLFYSLFEFGMGAYQCVLSQLALGNVVGARDETDYLPRPPAYDGDAERHQQGAAIPVTSADHGID